MSSSPRSAGPALQARSSFWSERGGSHVWRTGPSLARSTVRLHQPSGYRGPDPVLAEPDLKHSVRAAIQVDTSLTTITAAAPPGLGNSDCLGGSLSAPGRT